MNARGLQDRVDGRLSRLKAESLEAGLVSPLERSHVESFLMEADGIFESRLKGLIASELKRQKDIEEKARLKAEAEARKIREETELAAKLAEEKRLRDIQEAKEKTERETREKVRIEEATKKAAEPIKAVYTPMTTFVPPASALKIDIEKITAGQVEEMRDSTETRYEVTAIFRKISNNPNADIGKMSEYFRRCLEISDVGEFLATVEVRKK
jgi:hypothetical protein